MDARRVGVLKIEIQQTVFSKTYPSSLSVHSAYPKLVQDSVHDGFLKWENQLFIETLLQRADHPQYLLSTFGHIQIGTM